MANEYQTLRMHLFGSVVVAAALSLSAPVGAGDAPAGFKALDADGDGYISAKEAAVRKDLEERWVLLDKNADNQLDVVEFSAFEAEGQPVPPPEIGGHAAPPAEGEGHAAPPAEAQ